MRINTCSQKTMTFASKSALSGMRHALSVPQSAAPSATTTPGSNDAAVVPDARAGRGLIDREGPPPAHRHRGEADQAVHQRHQLRHPARRRRSSATRDPPG